jgi:hypothetical protein
MQPRHDRADGRAHDLGDLLVGNPSTSAKYTAMPEVLRELLQGLLDLTVGQVLQAATSADFPPPGVCDSARASW